MPGYSGEAMTRSVYNIMQEPVGETYRALVAFCSNHATEMLLVVRDSKLYEDAARSTIPAIEALGASCIDASEWPGTQLTHGGTAHIYHVPVTYESIEFVSNTANSLYDWLFPALPEDLCFMRNDGEEILASISHEEDAYLTLTEDEHNELIMDHSLRLLNIERGR